MAHLSIHESMDSFKAEKDNLLRPHVALIKGGAKPVLGYAKAGSPFTAHEQGSAAFVDLGGEVMTPHGGVVVEYDFTASNRLLGKGRIYSGLEALYLDGQLYDIDNLVLNIDDTASASASGSGDALYKSIEMPSSVPTGKHTVEFVMGDALFYEGWLSDTTHTSFNCPAKNSIATHANGAEFVDLGLPSGRLWAKCNVGANQPSDFGLYFPWASTQGYADASQHTFNYTTGNTPYIEGSQDLISKINKYNNGTGGYAGNVDNLVELLLEDDAARANMGGMWMMPSKADFIELEKYCTYNWTGSGFEAVGPNGNSIFFPASGIGYNSKIWNLFEKGTYWSRSLCVLKAFGNNSAHTLYLDRENFFSKGNSFRYYGYSVRGVL